MKHKTFCAWRDFELQLIFYLIKYSSTEKRCFSRKNAGYLGRLALFLVRHPSPVPHVCGQPRADSASHSHTIAMARPSLPWSATPPMNSTTESFQYAAAREAICRRPSGRPQLRPLSTSFVYLAQASEGSPALRESEVSYAKKRPCSRGPQPTGSDMAQRA